VAGRRLFCQVGASRCRAEAKADAARWYAASTHYLLDSDDVVACPYDARETPNMVVIDREGRVAYLCAIDDSPRRRQDCQKLCRRRHPPVSEDRINPELRGTRVAT
jgi:hypothetical protein